MMCTPNYGQKMGKTPFFSVILPIYNVAPYLEQCIRSVLEQEFSDYELILVDDGSTDQCPEICDGYAMEFSHVKVIHKTNGGLSSARNAGLALARGQYIWFVDSDDWIEPNSLQILYDACRAERPDMVKFNFFRNGSNEETIMSNVPAGYYCDESQREQLLERAFLKPGTFHLSAWGNLYAAEFVRQNKLVFVSERQIGSEDYLFNLQALSAAKKICVITDSLYHYRLRIGSLTQKYRVNLPEKYTELYRQLLKYYSEQGILENNQSRISHFYVWHLLHGTCFANEYRVCDDHTRKDGRDHVRRFLKNSDFQYAVKKCWKKDFYWKQWLQVLAMRLGIEPIFYGLYVVKPQHKKGHCHESKYTPTQKG